MSFILVALPLLRGDWRARLLIMLLVGHVLTQVHCEFQVLFKLGGDLRLHVFTRRIDRIVWSWSWSWSWGWGWGWNDIGLSRLLALFAS
jgi:hypothetical protein